MVTKDFLIADVFTGNPLEGNQLGIFTDARGIDDDLMLKATRELNFSETVFFLKPDKPEPGEPRPDVFIRIFTPGGEIPFAGHPTLGSAWALAEALNKDTVTIQTKAGLVPVTLERDPATKKLTFGRMEQPIPRIEPYGGDAEALIRALGATPKADGLPVTTYTNGPAHTYIEFENEEAVASLTPDLQALTRLDKVHANCFARADDGKTWVTRLFAPGAGVNEDPATGSAAGPLAVHLARHGKIRFGEEIEIHQGDYISRPSVLYAAAFGTEDAIEKVVVGGRAVVVARGEYQLA